MQALKWKQVNAWRLSQHGLAELLPRRDFIDAATRTGGVQAQVMSAAEMAIWTRVDGLARADIQSALWHDRTLLKTWAMRGTLHLIAARDLPLYVAARSLHGTRSWANYFAYYGISPAQQAAMFAAVPHVLGSEPLTREQLATALADYIGAPKLRKLILASSWGSPLKPLAFRGDLCFGPSQGQNVTFVRPSAWIGAWQPVEPQAAFQEIARRYLHAYGPARLEDFAQWWGLAITSARQLFRSLADELEDVEIEGWRAVALRTTLEAIRGVDAAPTVRLLPLFDPYVLGVGRDVEPLLPGVHKRKVYRPQGWISAVVLVDGHMKGVWNYTTRRSRTVVTVEMFAACPASVRKHIQAEAERLAAFVGTAVELHYEAAT